MKHPLQITFRNMEPSDAVAARIEAEAARLETFHDRITRCHVIVEAPHRHHRHGELFHVRIDLGVPGAELVVGHEPSAHATWVREDGVRPSKHLEIHPAHKDVYVAIHDAFDSARRQLQEHRRRQRGDVKTHVPTAGREEGA